jgi:phosphoribosyl-ATP pyrophosphohydrolase
MSVFATLDALTTTIAARASVGDDAASYTATLLKKGPAHCAKKLGEEAVETAMAASSGDKAHTVAESADLLFHLLVLWQAMGINPREVMDELARREAQSGLAEKAARSTK